MNILFFLKPKSELDLVYEEDTLGSALQRIEAHQFSSIPVINERTGRYVGTIAEGDFLRAIMKDDYSIRTVFSRPVTSIRRKYDFRSVRIDENIEELFAYAKEQNFVPVVDDTGVLIGIVTRRSILEFIDDVANRQYQEEQKLGMMR